jgi:imidazole glycerol-phosphate synthase subunit HisH
VRVLLVDYGVGNILSVRRALETCGGEVEVSANPAHIRDAERLVLPGVGAFGDCVKKLRSAGLDQPITEFAASERPFLGICVGMQMLFESSEEFGAHEGLGLIAGRVTRIPASTSGGKPHKIPHIGWNSLDVPEPGTKWDGTILEGVEAGETCYFVHSYTAEPAEPAVRLADTDYGGRRISACVRSGSVFGCQFHPEKSGDVGLRILSNFLSIS